MNSKIKFSVVLYFFLCFVIGVVLFFRLPYSAIIKNDSSYITVNYYMEDSSPNTMENNVTTKLESIFSTLEGLKNIKSESNYSYGNISMEFDPQTDLQFKRFEISSIIRRIYPMLPQNLSYPSIKLDKPDREDEKPIMIINVQANCEPSKIYDYASNYLKPRFTSIKGIKEIVVYGGNQKVYEISFNPKIINKYGLTKDEILLAMSNKYKSEGLGFINHKNAAFRIILKNNPDDTFIENIPIKKIGSKIILLNEVANCKKIEKELQSIFRVNGKNSINIIIKAYSNFNQLELSDNLRATISKLNLPTGYFLDVELDETDSLRQNINKIGQEFALIFLVIFFICLIYYKDIILSIVVLSTYIFILSVCSIFIYILKIEVNFLTYIGVLISFITSFFGFLININYIKNNQKINIIPICITVSVNVIYIYILNLFYQEIAIINNTLYVFCILFILSALATTLYLPLVVKRIEKKTRESYFLLIISKIYLNYINSIGSKRKIVLVCTILLFGIPLFLIPVKISTTNSFSKFYNSFNESKSISEYIRPYMESITGGFYRIFYQKVLRYQSFNIEPFQKTQLTIFVSFPINTSIDRIDQVFKIIESEISKYPEIEKYVSNIYSRNLGQMIVYFKPESEKTIIPMIIKRKIIDISSVMSGINWDIYGVGPGYSQSTSDKELANFKLEITGFNYNDLLFYLNVLKRKLEGNKRIVKINIEANEYTNFFTEKEKIGIYPNDRNMALQGIDKLTFYQNLFEYKVNKNPNFNTIIANKYTSFYISPEDFDFDIWYYQNTNSLYNQITKLKDNTTTINSQYASPVFRNNQEYIKWVSFDFLGNNRFASSAIKKIIEDMNNNVLPLGFKCKLSKVQNSIDVESKNYSYSILFYLTIVYIIASIFMESLIAPLKIIYCTCLSFVGIFIASIHYNINFDIGGYASFFTISFFMLTILIYTYFLSKKGRGIGIVLLKISSVVLISAVAIITMLIPFMLLEETTFFWRSYCICTIGGIIFSVLNIFFIVPAILSPLKKSN